MRLSTKGRFAVTAMIDVGLRANAGPVSLADISTRHRISLSYLEQLFSKLRQHGLVVSTRGPGGGYNLARHADAISVADIVGAVEGAGRDGDENEHAMSEEAGAAAMTAELWATLNAKMMTYLQSITLETLVSEQRARGVEVERKPARRGHLQAAPVRTGAANHAELGVRPGRTAPVRALNLCPARRWATM
jgi:Rrf2 family iron-sulfur cluster assembly transcriptional regulator